MSGEVVLPAELLAFLMGEQPLEGVWFGDPWHGGRGAFWWRNRLAALPPVAPSDADRTAVVEECARDTLEDYSYDELWQAIADATRVEAGMVAISVVKFRAAIRRLSISTGEDR